MYNIVRERDITLTTFKHQKYFDYKVRGARSNNCILINAHNWLANTSNDIIGLNSRGGIANNYITEVLDTNIENEHYASTIAAGDTVMLTSVASRLYCSHTFTIPVGFDNIDYTDIPVSHIVGKFEKNKISFSTFKVLSNFVMLERLNDVDTSRAGVLQTTTKTKTICKVVKVGPDVEYLKVGDIVLIRDNVSTDTMLDGKPYSIVTEDMVAGVFNTSDFNSSLYDNLVLRHNFILMEEYQPNNAAGSSVIINPQYDASQDEGMSAIYSETTYKVLLSNVADIIKDDIVYMPRAAVEYITYRGMRYYLAQNSNFVLATIRGEI